MDKNILFLFSLTIIFPSIIGLIRYRKITPSYRPFLWYIFISLFNEVLVYCLGISNPGSKKMSIIDWNLFNIFECLIFLTQFYCWELYTKSKGLFLFAAPLLLISIADNFLFNSISSFNYIFLICYSMVIALFSIYTINTIVIKHNRSLFSNAMFVICVGLIIYFVYTIIVFTFLLAGNDKDFQHQIFNIKVYVNAFVNLLYGVAVLLIPLKTKRTNYFDEVIMQKKV